MDLRYKARTRNYYYINNDYIFHYDFFRINSCCTGMKGKNRIGLNFMSWNSHTKNIDNCLVGIKIKDAKWI